jgi:hypothetical protein
MSKPHSDNQPEVTTYYQLQRNRDALPEPGESNPAPVMPALPASSPWAASIDEICGAEPPIDGTSEATININSEDQT